MLPDYFYRKHRRSRTIFILSIGSPMVRIKMGGRQIKIKINPAGKCQYLQAFRLVIESLLLNLGLITLYPTHG